MNEYLKEHNITYEEYLKSKHWERVKNRKFKKNPKMYKCVVCNYRKGLHLHHKTYARLGKEKLRDLIWLCEICHKNLHEDFKKSNQSLSVFTNSFIQREKKRLTVLGKINR